MEKTIKVKKQYRLQVTYKWDLKIHHVEYIFFANDSKDAKEKSIPILARFKKTYGGEFISSKVIRW